MFLAVLGVALLISLQHSQGASVDHPSLRMASTGDSDGDSKRPATYMLTTCGDGEADEDDNRQAAAQDKEGIPHYTPSKKGPDYAFNYAFDSRCV